MNPIHRLHLHKTTVVQQFYQSEVNNEYVIRGNSAVLKCSIPSFVADFVSVVSWHDEDEVQLGAADDEHMKTKYGSQ